MTIFNPLLDLSALARRLNREPGLVIACYCAQWCDTCRQYLADFQALAEKWPQHTFVWIDIEDSPELLGEEDIENFPTLAIQGPERTLFFGTLLPFISHLDKLIGRAGSMTEAVAKAPPLLRPLLAATAQ